MHVWVAHRRVDGNWRPSSNIRLEEAAQDCSQSAMGRLRCRRGSLRWGAPCAQAMDGSGGKQPAARDGSRRREDLQRGYTIHKMPSDIDPIELWLKLWAY